MTDGIGQVPEGRKIFPFLTGRENFDLGGVRLEPGAVRLRQACAPGQGAGIRPHPRRSKLRRSTLVRLQSTVTYQSADSLLCHFR